MRRNKYRKSLSNGTTSTQICELIEVPRIERVQGILVSTVSRITKRKFAK